MHCQLNTHTHKHTHIHIHMDTFHIYYRPRSTTIIRHTSSDGLFVDVLIWKSENFLQRSWNESIC